jgi:hypothetical protein
MHIPQKETLISAIKFSIKRYKMPKPIDYAAQADASPEELKILYDVAGRSLSFSRWWEIDHIDNCVAYST